MRGREGRPRPWAAALALTALLSGCARPLPEETPAPTPTPVETPALPQTPTPTPEPAVYTDWSKLEPYEPLKPVYTRRYREFTDHLIPAEDYGALLPFPGQLVYGGYMGDLPLYGLVTLKGEIVVDPVYSDVWEVSSYDYDTNTRRSLDVLELVLATPSRLRALCARDGSWCTDFLYTRVELFDGGIFAVRGTTLVLIDPLTGAETYALDYSPYMTGADGGGVYSVHLDPEEGWLSLNLYLYRGEASEGWYSDDYESWQVPLLFDPQGNLCPMPEGVTRLGRYGDGLALAWGPEGEGDTCQGYIDAAGSWVIPPTLTQAYPFEQGAALVSDAGGYHFIDPQGNSLTDPIPCDSAVEYDGCWYLLGRDRDVAAVYGKNHLMVSNPLAGLGRSVSFLGGGWVVARDEDNTLLVRGEQLVQVPLSLGKLFPIDESCFLFSRDLGDGRTALTVTDQAGEVLFTREFDGGIYRAYLAGAGVLQVNNSYYDLQGNELGSYTGMDSGLTAYGDVIAITTQRDFSLTGSDGKVLFYWPYPSGED